MVQISWFETLQSQFNSVLLSAELLSDLINVGAVDHSHPSAFLAEKRRKLSLIRVGVTTHRIPLKVLIFFCMKQL